MHNVKQSVFLNMQVDVCVPLNGNNSDGSIKGNVFCPAEKSVGQFYRASSLMDAKLHKEWLLQNLPL